MKPTVLPVVLREVSRCVTCRPEEMPTKYLRIAADKLLKDLDKRLDKRRSDLFRPFERAILEYHMEQHRATSVAQREAADATFRQALTDANITITFS
ncbi:MAG: hypothetical protein ACI910_002882 [Oleispira sp.]|jgi:hypothetical protein